MEAMENTQNLIGRKFKGFKFKFIDYEMGYNSIMDNYINSELEIIKINNNQITANNSFIYPLKEVLNHLIPEETEIHELPEGVLMLVSDDGENWEEANVIGKKNGFFYAWMYNSLVYYDHCKPIPKLPNYTLQELKEKIGYDFNLID